MLILQLVPADRVVPPVGEQLFVTAGTTAKSAPFISRPPTVKGSFPVFFRTIFFAPELSPTCTVPKVNPVLESTGVDCPVAMPLR